MRVTSLALLWLLFLAAGCAAPGTGQSSVAEHKNIEVGTGAPDFWLKNQDQQRVSLSGLRGRQNVILVFFPMAFTPV